MRLVLAALVASTGCAQLFGIDETTGADANTDFASVQVQRVSVGASVVKGPQDLSSQSAQFLPADGTAVPGVLAGTDTFTVDLPGTPAVMFTVPDPTVPQRLWALPARNQRGNYVVLEHASPQPPLTMSKLMLSVTLPSPYASTESFSLQAIGAWMQHTLTAAELPAPDVATSTTIAPAAIDYALFTAMAGNAKNRITASDVVLLLRYAAAKLTGVFQAQFDQTDGTDSITGTMTAVQANSMLTAQIDPAGFTTRFAAVRPAVGAVTMPWRVTAAPGWSVGDSNGVRLVNGAASLGSMTVPADTMVMTTFGNPFESLDWKALFVFAANTSRTYAFTDGTATATATLVSNLVNVAEPGTTLNLTMPAGLPITVRANAATLTADGMMLPLDLSKPVEIDAIIDKPTNTAYQLTLVELGVDASGTVPVITKKIIVDAFTTGMPKFSLPPTLFTVGKTYYIAFRCYQGAYAAAASGDLQTISLPYSYGTLDSAVFTVGMP